MADFDQKKLVALVKKGKTHSECAEILGLTVGQLSMLKFCQAQVDAGEYDEVNATPKNVLRLRDKENYRWELIAAIIGEGVAKTKSLYAEAGGDPATSYTGRGRNFANGDNGESKKSETKSTGRRSRRSTKDEDTDNDDNGDEEQEEQPKRGRRSAARGANKPASGGRSRTRSSRARRGSGNPS